MTASGSCIPTTPLFMDYLFFHLYPISIHQPSFLQPSLSISLSNQSLHQTTFTGSPHNHLMRLAPIRPSLRYTIPDSTTMQTSTSITMTSSQLPTCTTLRPIVHTDPPQIPLIHQESLPQPLRSPRAYSTIQTSISRDSSSSNPVPFPTL